MPETQPPAANPGSAQSTPAVRSKLKIIRLVSYALVACLGAAWGGLWLAQAPDPAALVGAEIGGPFELVDDSGQTVTDRTYRGKWMMVFFGYTHCPDVCPLALSTISQALDALGPLAAQVQPLFVTVDPARDTVASLHDFVTAFDRRIVGLTGTATQIAEAAKAYRAYYRRVDDGADYSMDHTALIYVMRPDGPYATHLLHQDDPDRIAARLKALIQPRPNI